MAFGISQEKIEEWRDLLNNSYPINELWTNSSITKNT
jgi:hypothetical protein